MRRGLLVLLIFLFSVVNANAFKCFYLYASTTKGVYSDPVVTVFGWEQTQISYIVPSTDTYYFVLTAYDGQESDRSREIEHDLTEGNIVTFGWKYGERVIDGTLANRSNLNVFSTQNITLNEGGGSTSLGLITYSSVMPNKMELGTSDTLELGDTDNIVF